jgi:pyruvate-formate lyase-activating enzyme
MLSVCGLFLIDAKAYSDQSYKDNLASMKEKIHKGLKKLGKHGSECTPH